MPTSMMTSTRPLSSGTSPRCDVLGLLLDLLSTFARLPGLRRTRVFFSAGNRLLNLARIFSALKTSCLFAARRPHRVPERVARRRGENSLPPSLPLLLSLNLSHLLPLLARQQYQPLPTAQHPAFTHPDSGRVDSRRSTSTRRGLAYTTSLLAPPSKGEGGMGGGWI
jgi:hypothetical protein